MDKTSKVARRVAVTILLCISALQMPDTTQAQKVKSNYDKSANFGKYKKYAWGKNYLLTRQTKTDEANINLAIIDSINRDLQAAGFVFGSRESGLHDHLRSGRARESRRGTTGRCVGHRHGQLLMGQRDGNLFGRLDLQPGENADYCNRCRDKEHALAGYGLRENSRPQEIHGEPERERRQIHTNDDEKFPAKKVILHLSLQLQMTADVVSNLTGITR